MADIHRIADSGHSCIEPMRTRVPTFSWDEILIRGAQLARLPLNKSQPVSARTVIGPGAAVPLVIDSPLIVSHMSFGALSREAKLALAKSSAEAKTAMLSPDTWHLALYGIARRPRTLYRVSEGILGRLRLLRLLAIPPAT